MSYSDIYLAEAATILQKIDTEDIEGIAALLSTIRSRHGRLFFLGVGGSAANCSHAVNDFRKIAGFEAYTPTDNVAELTARINDDGWHTTFVEWLKTNRLQSTDAVVVFSVGGGTAHVSANLVRALDYAYRTGAYIIGIVGSHGGYTAEMANACIKIPTINEETQTPHVEEFQAIIWHLLVNHPLLKAVS